MCLEGLCFYAGGIMCGHAYALLHSWQLLPSTGLKQCHVSLLGHWTA